MSSKYLLSVPCNVLSLDTSARAVQEQPRTRQVSTALSAGSVPLPLCSKYSTDTTMFPVSSSMIYKQTVYEA